MTETAPATRRRIPLPPFGAQILLALVLGLALGYLARTAQLDWLGATLDTVGSLFVQLLKLAVPPLVFTAIVASIVQLQHLTNAARLAASTLGWFALSGLIAVGVGLGLGVLTNPGEGVALDVAGAQAPKKQGSWTDFLVGIVPTNPVEAFVEGNVLQIVFLAVVVGFAAMRLGDKAQPFLTVNAALLEITQKALWWVILLAPIGTLGLIGGAVTKYGWDLPRRWRPSPSTSTSAARSSCSASTRCSCGSSAASIRCASSPARGPRSSSPSFPAPRSARCR